MYTEFIELINDIERKLKEINHQFFQLNLKDDLGRKKKEMCLAALIKVKNMQKLSYTSVSNKSNVLKVRIFHVYRHGKNCKSKTSFFVKTSVKKLRPLRKIEFKRKRKIFGVIVRTRQ